MTLLSAGQRVHRLLLIRLIYSTQDKTRKKKKKKKIFTRVWHVLVTPMQSKHQVLPSQRFQIYIILVSGFKGTVTAQGSTRVASRLSTGDSMVQDMQIPR